MDTLKADVAWDMSVNFGERSLRLVLHQVAFFCSPLNWITFGGLGEPSKEKTKSQSFDFSVPRLLNALGVINISFFSFFLSRDLTA